ncbi:MAG: hypothetical protein IJ251_02420, partial [Oscillospiraceae bacterium]|nr:hypothetical protein [Oscillospiraceae bacterium]
MSASGLIFVGAGLLASLLLKNTIGNTASAFLDEHAYAPLELDRVSDRILNSVSLLDKRRLDRMNGELGDALDAVAGIDREMSADLDKCRAECAGEYAAAAERLRRQLDSDGDADVFAKGCAEISDKFDRQFSAAHSELDVRYRNKIAQTMDTAIEKMHMGRRETERALEQIEDAEERKAQYAKVTKERIESLSAQIDKLSARFDGKKAAEAVRILTEQLAQARANLEGGLTEAALIDVF